LASILPTHSRDRLEKPLTKKEKIEAAVKRKNQGNTCFKDGDHQNAARRYLQAIVLADDLLGGTSPLEEEEKNEVSQCKVASHLNLAAVCLKASDWKRVIDNCQKALDIDPQNVKARFRRAEALKATKDYDQALLDLNAALKIDPNNAEVTKASNLIKKLIQERTQKEKQAYAKMFS